MLTRFVMSRSVGNEIRENIARSATHLSKIELLNYIQTEKRLSSEIASNDLFLVRSYPAWRLLPFNHRRIRPISGLRLLKRYGSADKNHKFLGYGHD